MSLPQAAGTMAGLPDVEGFDDSTFADYAWQLKATTAGDVVSGSGDSRAAAWGDYDGDGRLDLFVANFYGANELYHNAGGGSFTKVTSGDVVSSTGSSQSAAWGDYDGDGRLDLFVANGGAANELYHNAGGGSFTKVTSGDMVSSTGNSQSAAWGDYDGDGRLDLFVANFGMAIELHRSSTGCPEGVSLASSSVCVRCPDFTTQVGNACIECDPNIIVGSTGKCSFACPSGYVRPYGVDACTACAAGQFYNQSSSCEPCPAGEYTYTVASMACSRCPLGSASSTHSATSCAACSAGTFSAALGATSCAICKPGGYCSATDTCSIG